jgi:hypothetical protein
LIDAQVGGVSRFSVSNTGLASANSYVSAQTSTATAAGTTTLTIASSQTQVFTGTTTQTVLLPTTGVVAGQKYTIVNNSTGTVTVQSSAANFVCDVDASRHGVFTALIDTPTSNAHWRPMVPTDGTTSRTVVQRDTNGWATCVGFLPFRGSTATAAGITTLTSASRQNQVFTGTTTQTVRLPTTNIWAAMTYTIVNQSTGDVTVQSSAGNTITTMTGGAAPTARLFVALQDTPTADTHWRAI